MKRSLLTLAAIVFTVAVLVGTVYLSPEAAETVAAFFAATVDTTVAFFSPTVDTTARPYGSTN